MARDSGTIGAWYTSWKESVCDTSHTQYVLTDSVLITRRHLIIEQDPETVEPEETSMAQDEASARAVAAFETVIADSKKIQYDHFLLYYARECHDLTRSGTLLTTITRLRTRPPFGM